MSRDLRNVAITAALAVIGLVACLTAAETLDAHWLYVPAVAFFLAALVIGEMAVWGSRGMVLLLSSVAAVIAVAVVIAKLT